MIPSLKAHCLVYILSVALSCTQLARVGSLVVQSGESDEDRRGVILSPPANTGTAQAMDLKTRKPWAVSGHISTQHKHMQCCCRYVQYM